MGKLSFKQYSKRIKENKRTRFRNKKKHAQMDVQFNWIFVLIAGAVILAFFFTVIQKQKSISEQKVSLSLINDFETITTGALQAKDTVQTIELPNVEIGFKCSEECTCSFSIGSIDRDFKDKIIFAPKTIKGSDIAVWTLDWNLPFRVSNFLYISNRNVIFYLVYEEGNADSERLLDQLERKLPNDINFETITTAKLSTTQNANYLKAKFVFLAVGEDKITSINIKEFEDSDPSVLIINPTTKELSFFDRTSQKAKSFESVLDSFYATEEDLIGAIFADDFYNYECNMRKVFSKTNYVAEIYKARIEVFSAEPSLVSCPYSTLELDTIIDQANILKYELKSLSTISGAANSLSSINDILLRKSCPTIY